jgi:hypothetical protein
MHRVKRKGKLSGHQYVVKKHKGDGKTVSVPLSKVVYGSTGRKPAKPADSRNVLTDPPPDAPDNEEDCDSRKTANLTDYSAAKRQQLAEWASLRPRLLSAAFNYACPPTSSCQLCPPESSQCCNLVACPDCGPAYFACPSCAQRDHKLRPLHAMRIWTVSTYLFLCHSLILVIV